jgi:hypothetical protein
MKGKSSPRELKAAHLQGKKFTKNTDFDKSSHYEDDSPLSNDEAEGANFETYLWRDDR